MLWIEFLAAVSAATAAGLYLKREALRGQWGRLARVLVFGCAAGFPLDYIAEDRVFWRFSHPSGIRFFGVPAENIAFIAIFMTDIILIHLGCQQFLIRRSARAPTQE